MKYVLQPPAGWKPSKDEDLTNKALNITLHRIENETVEEFRRRKGQPFCKYCGGKSECSFCGNTFSELRRI